MYSHGITRTADKSGICPMCHVFIAKNRSRVMNIPRPLAPRIRVLDWNDGYVCADTGKPWYFDARHPGSQKRWIVHVRCYLKAIERIAEEYGIDYEVA